MPAPRLDPVTVVPLPAPVHKYRTGGGDLDVLCTMTSRVDVVIFGASGFTGQYVVEHAAEAAKKEAGGFTFAVAGRSEAKLRKVLAEAARVTNSPKLEKSTEVIIADVADQVRSLGDEIHPNYMSQI